MIHKTIAGYLKHTQTTGKELADTLGISTSYMSMLRLGQRRPSPQLAQKIEDVTGILFKKLLLVRPKPQRLSGNRRARRERAS